MLEKGDLMRFFKAQKVPKPDLCLKIPDFLVQKMQQNALNVPIELEIGAGDGEFSVKQASQNPHIQFIAIEKSRNLYHAFLKQYNNQQLDNLWFFHTNAVWFITHFVPAKSLNKISIFYPNTYPKLKQANLRWINRSFMPYLLSCLVFGGQLEMRTNSEAYYLEFKSGMQRKFSFMNKTKDLLLKHPASTRFERKYMDRQECCRTLVFKNNLL